MSLFKLDDVVTNLKRSPVFNMSLASKELFHSNFIAWLLERGNLSSSPQEFLKLFFPDEKLEDLIVLTVEREVKNFDLKLTLENGSKVVIENKIKSLPSRIQLQKYSNSIAKEKGEASKKTNCVLLSLTEPDFFSGSDEMEIDGYRWRFVNYTSVSEALEKIACHENSENRYIGDIILDYQFLIDSLIKIKKCCEFMWKKPQNLLQYGGDKYKALKKIRLHDIYEKWRMEALKKMLSESIGLENMKTGYSNQQGILDISPDPPERDSEVQYRYMLQIQGNQLRQVIEKDKDNPSDLYKKAKELLDSKEWFIDKNGEPLQPNKRSSKDKGGHDGFCKFGDIFVYRHESIENIQRIIDLASKMKELPSND